MRKIIKCILALLLIAIMCMSLSACNSLIEEKELWDVATYTEDTELGNGAKTVLVEVRAEERCVTFKINTDKENLGEALLEHNLVSGENGAYGLYIKVVNGITADYDIDKSYWAITKNGEGVMSGVDGIEISDGEHYELVYTK